MGFKDEFVDYVKNRALFISLVDILLSKGIISNEDMLSARNESELADILVGNKVIDVEDLNVLMIGYRGFLSGIVKAISDPDNFSLHIRELRNKYDNRYAKILDFVEVVASGVE